MERDQQGKKKHRCKVCRKCFPSGRSLGGHMRSHVTVSSSSVGAVNGYGLRENPKRTWRLCDSIGEEEPSEKQCRECGKCFSSWQALFGHMRCHSDKFTAIVVGGDEEEEEVVVEEEEDVDVALTLMMLSRDTGNWDMDVERSKEEIFVSETDDNGDDDEDDECDVDEIKNKGLRKIGAFDANATVKKSLYECSTCKKSFHSYQALGGHRAGHKRLRMDSTDGTVIPEGRGGAMPGLLDLNLPAEPQVDGDSKFKPSWWKYEAMVGLISN
ncbi:hypothetical protein J5N97_028601 [Dioscorea zingiberensis]|uniref:C2H2-type domain-containing protein n=1 Tax=Dioscorea zingiberensis TaxID=325984 RepID=A0A9D5BZG7_9LILI|nr:hypothetical protein J5N97_028601 [Dioscorea zingiberensis]